MEKIKTIAQQLEEVVEEMCDKYCKWPEKWDEEMEGCELCESSICQNCPLNKLV
mgnify:CR=1 FL=1